MKYNDKVKDVLASETCTRFPRFQVPRFILYIHWKSQTEKVYLWHNDHAFTYYSSFEKAKDSFQIDSFLAILYLT